MLVLSRKLYEAIQIGDNITITVCRIGGDTVQIGIEAPKDVNIARTELLTGPAGSAEHKAKDS